ncbi:phage head closure protein [Pyruvatibacter sp.]|uniref:phage head closure protein n=1 Tax=Pyruvatibacter sp. TaxID=1981328 RepID=UPI003266809F
MTSSQVTRPGDMCHRLILEQPVFVSDGGGGTARSWQLAATLWGAITPLSPARGVEAEQPGGRINYRVTCRFRSDIKPGQRFRTTQQTLEIYAVVDPDGCRRWIECRCREHQS